MTDVAIVGGAAFGLSSAFWLKRRNPDIRVTVVERDSGYTTAATPRAVGGVRQQFSLEENIKLSMFGSHFFRNVGEYLGVGDYDADDCTVQWRSCPYLILARQESADVLERSHRLQLELGASVELLTPIVLKDRYPWLHTEDVALAAVGSGKEGRIDPWLYLSALRKKCLSMGVEIVKALAVDFCASDKPQISGSQRDNTKRRLQSVVLQDEDKNTCLLDFDICVNCAGPWAGQIMDLANQCLPESGRISLPVVPRKRYVFVVHCPAGPTDKIFVIGPSGEYIVPDGDRCYLCGVSPCEADEPMTDNLDSDHDFFDEKVWPLVSKTVPALEALKVKASWAGYYDYNTLDQNLVFGFHPFFDNFLIAAGASGHGLQQSPAIGRAVMEIILRDGPQTIDLRRFSIDRILEDKPLFEENIF